MEKTSPVLFTFSVISLSKFSECYARYGKYIKWTLCGFAVMLAVEYCIEALIERFRKDSKDRPPPSGPRSANSDGGEQPDENAAVVVVLPSVADEASVNPTVSRPVVPRRPAILRGPFGFEELPILENRESVQAFISRHVYLSQKYLARKDHNRATYHSTLLFLIQPDPMAFYEANRASATPQVHDAAKTCLQCLLSMVEEQANQEQANREQANQEQANQQQ